MPKLRIEFCSLGSGRGQLGGQIDLPAGEPLGSATLDVSAAPTAVENRPSVPAGAGTIFVRLLAVDSPIYCDLGTPPDPASEPRLLLLPGREQIVHGQPGQAIAAMLASDIAVLADSGATGFLDRSGALAAGGAAQQACAANPVRRFLLIANPDDARSFWFSAAGAASAGAGSAQLGPGAAIVFDKVVPAGAVSISGAAAGQPFTVWEA